MDIDLTPLCFQLKVEENLIYGQLPNERLVRVIVNQVTCIRVVRLEKFWATTFLWFCKRIERELLL